jgi:tRNA(Ile)-lysidine synthase
MEHCQETLKKVVRTISFHNMIGPGERIVVAVSGGADSVCLLDILFVLRKEFESELVVAHFDHGLRPDDDDAETRFVRSLAEFYGLRFVVQQAHSPVGSERGFSEERAREFRYRFFYQVLEDTYSSKIAVGHNLNDQAETVVMRLLRGSGPSGLGGIPPIREDRIIRPLIELKRIEIENYLNTRGLKYITDPTNFDKNHLRNKVRLELIPMLEGYQPKLVENLGKTAEIMRQDEEWFRKKAEGWLSKNVKSSDGGCILIDTDRLKGLPRGLRNRVIRYLIEMAGGSLREVSVGHISSINKLSESTRAHSRVDLPGNVTVKKIYNRLNFSKDSGVAFGEFSHLIQRPGSYRLKDLEGDFSIEEIERKSLMDLTSDPHIAYLNGDLLSFPLYVRNFRPGDRFVPLGMKGHKKVKDFFIDLKIPLDDRKRLPILTYEDKPIWIFDQRIDDRFRVTPETKKVIKVVWKKP